MKHIKALGVPRYTSYTAGCRCDDCRSAAKLYQRQHRLEQKERPEPFDWTRINMEEINPFNADPAVKAVATSPDLDIGQKIEAITKLIGQDGMDRIAAELKGEAAPGAPAADGSGQPAESWAVQRKTLGLDQLGNGLPRKVGSVTSNRGILNQND